MVPQTYISFFTDSASAAGALIGLLFVAIALRPDSIFSVTGSTAGRALAGSTFTALVNAFMVSLMATIPKINLGIVAAVMSAICLLSTVRLHRHIARREAHVVVLAFSVAAYLAQLGEGVALATRPHDSGPVFAISYLTISSFAVALIRAWDLLQGKHLESASENPLKAGPPTWLSSSDTCDGAPHDAPG